MIEFPSGTPPDVIAAVMTREVVFAYEALHSAAEQARQSLGATLEQKIAFTHEFKQYTYVNGILQLEE